MLLKYESIIQKKRLPKNEKIQVLVLVLPLIRAALVAQTVKNPPAMQVTWVQSLGCEDPLEKGTATHSSILAWRILYSPWGCKESDMTERLSLSVTV